MPEIVVLRCLKLFCAEVQSGEAIVVYPGDIFLAEVQNGEVCFVITPAMAFHNKWTWVLLTDGSSHYYEVLSA